MKKFAWLWIIASLTFFVAFGQQSKTVKVTDPYAFISAADLASSALIHTKKDCYSVSDLVSLKLLRDAQSAIMVANALKKGSCPCPPGSPPGAFCSCDSTMVALKMGCPCPPGSRPGAFCSCDSTAMTSNYATLDAWKAQLALVNVQKKDTSMFVKKDTQNGITYYQLPDKLADGNYTLHIVGKFGGGDPPPMKFDYPAYLKKGKLYLLK